MAHPSPATPQPDAVSRRLSLLSAELEAVRGGHPVGGHTHVRPLPAPAAAPSPLVGPADETAPQFPAPGRHAARSARQPPAPRWRERLADRVPATLRGRVRLTGAHLAFLALAVAAGLALAAWWSVRSATTSTPAPPVPTVVAGLETPASGTLPAGGGLPSGVLPTAGATGAAAPAATVVVDVAGAVRRPGIVVLGVGARVVDALEAAGGARPWVDLGTLNQARLLVDGEQIVVGGPLAPGGVAASAAAHPTGPDGTTLIDLNTATGPQLEELPGVGPVTAQSILDWRAEHGGFTSVDELLEVDGIGPATLADVAPHVTL